MRSKKELFTAAVIQKVNEAIKEDYLFFIENFVKIIDADTRQLIPFKLWPEQKRALQEIHDNRLTIVLKSRQLGMTWLCLSYCLWNMIAKPGFHVSALSKGEKEAQELVSRMKLMLANLPPYIAAQGKGSIRSWDGTSEKVIITHPEGLPAEFLSFSASPDSARAFTSSLLLIDEWAFQQYAEEIYTSAFPTINRSSGKVIGLSTGKRNTFFEKMCNEALSGANKFKLIFLNWRADPRRDDKWYEDTKLALPNTYRQEYPETIEDAFAAGSGAFFPEWDREVHVINDPAWYPPKECQIYGAYDAGYGSYACFKWYAVFPNGQIVCYREYYPKQVTDPEQAEKIKKLSVDSEGNPEYLVAVYADPSCWNKQSGTGMSTAQIFAEHGIYMLPADNDIANGWRRLHQYLKPIVLENGMKTALLRFTVKCANTIRTYPSVTQDKNNPEDISKHSEHHCQDVDRYLVMSNPVTVDYDAIKAGGFPGTDFYDDEDGEIPAITFYSR